jgi:hypothetical protein
MRSTCLVFLAAAVAIMSPLQAAAKWPHRGMSGGCNQALVDRLEGLPTEPLSTTEEVALVHLREEEKLARDVYATLATRWQVPVFDNIAAAEQRHMDLMAALLERYGVGDPVADDSTGVFTDPVLAELFATLTERGETSLEQALRVGATIEDLDLADLEQLLAETDNADVTLVANNLAKGSRNHLRAFARTLEASGFGPYVAQHLGQEQVDQILASGHERGVVYDEAGAPMAGRAGGRGYGQGNAWGRGRGYGRGHGHGRGRRDGSCVAAGSQTD